MGVFKIESMENQIPWILVDDFNSVLRNDDRLGGSPITLGEVLDF